MIRTLRLKGRGSKGSTEQTRTRRLLVITEFALSLVLMIAAGLLLRSFWDLFKVRLGFNPEHVMAVRLWLPVPNDPKTNPYPKPEDETRLVREVLRRVLALPGVTSASMSTEVPMSRGGTPTTITLEDRAARDGGLTAAETISVSPDYFRTLETPLYRGRFFNESDQTGSQLNVLVDRTAANQFWPGESPLGKRVRLGGPQSTNP